MQVKKYDSPIRRMAQEKLAFSCHGMPDILLALDIFLAPIYNSNVT